MHMQWLPRKPGDEANFYSYNNFTMEHGEQQQSWIVLDQTRSHNIM